MNVFHADPEEVGYLDTGKPGFRCTCRCCHIKNNGAPGWQETSPSTTTSRVGVEVIVEVDGPHGEAILGSGGGAGEPLTWRQSGRRRTPDLRVRFSAWVHAPGEIAAGSRAWSQAPPRGWTTGDRELRVHAVR
jgi:hypothetical protein